MNKRIIWSNRNLDLDDWRDDLEEWYPDADENELWNIMHETNDGYLDDERMNLNIELPCRIICIADLGFWYGRRSGYQMGGTNIADCLNCDNDYNEWYVDDLGDLCCTSIHHDGTNYYLYRVFKESATDTQIENLKAKIYNGTVTRRDITRVTNRLGDYIAAVYGWKFKGMKPVTIKRGW